MGVREYKGAAPSTTLSGSLTSGATTIVISSGTNWPTGSFSVVIDPGLPTEEKVLVTSRSGTSLTVTTRGYDDTSASAHSSGATIYPVPTAIDFQEANTHTNSGLSGHGIYDSGSGSFYGIPNANADIGNLVPISTASTIYYHPFTVLNSVVISEIGINVYSAGTAGAKVRLAIYKANTDSTAGNLVVDLGELAVDSTGFKSFTGLTRTLTTGSYTVRLHTDASATQPRLRTVYALPNSTTILVTNALTASPVYQSASRTYGVAESPGQSVAIGADGATSTTYSGRMLYFVVMKWTA